MNFHIDCVVISWSAVQRIDVVNPGALAGWGGRRPSAAAHDRHSHLTSKHSRRWTPLRDLLSIGCATAAIDSIRQVRLKQGLVSNELEMQAECAPRSQAGCVPTEVISGSQSVRDTFVVFPTVAWAHAACSRFAAPVAQQPPLAVSFQLGHYYSCLWYHRGSHRNAMFRLGR